MTAAGFNAGNTVITNVAIGAVSATSTDAVNGSQLFQVNQAIGQGLNFSGNSGGVVNRTLGQTLVIQGAATAVGTYSGANLKTVTDPATGAINLQMADAPTFGTVAINSGGTGQISGVTAGTAGTDAVNLNQLNAVATTAAKGFNVTTAQAGTGVASGTAVANVAPGATVTTTAGNNIAITQVGTDLTIATNPNMILDSVKTGNTTINNAGVTVVGGPNGTVALGNTGLNNGGNVIGNIAAGVAATDAVNVSQLNAVAATAAKGYNVTIAQTGTGVASGTSVANVAPGATVTTTAGNNISITQVGTDLTIATNPNMILDSVKTGNTTINNAGVTVVGGPNGTVALGNTGLNNGGNVIGNIAAGVAATDAVNVSQLTAGVAAAKTEVAAGTNVSSVVQTTGKDGQSIYTVNANGTKASAGSAALTVTAGAKDANNVTNYAVDLSAATKASLATADTALQTVVSQIDGVDVKTISKTDNKANFVSGTNVALTDDGKGGIKVSTTPDATFTTVTTGKTKLDTTGLTITGGPSVTTAGINANDTKITNLAPGVIAAGSKDAVNGSQLFQTNSTVTNLGNSTAANLGGGAVYNAATGTVSAPTYNVYGAPVTSVAGAITALQTGGPVQYSDPAGSPTPQVKSNDVTLVGAAAGPVKLHNVANGVAPTDAVNVSQLAAASTAAVGIANQYTDSQVAAVRGELSGVRADLSAGIAGARAMASMPQAYTAGKSMLALGVGAYGGQTAIALGFSKVSDNGRWIIKLDASADSRRKVGVGFGAGYQW